MYKFPYHSLVTSYLVSSAYFRCKACSFPKHFTPKSSTNKVKFIGRLLCFHTLGGLLEGWYPCGSRCFNRASCAICPAWGSPYIPFVTLAYMYPLCAFSARLYFLQILVVSLKAGSWCICPCPSGCSGRNPLRPFTCIFIWRLIWRCLYGVLWWSIMMLVCWPLLDNRSDSLLQWVLFYRSLFLGSDIAYSSHICRPYVLWFEYMEYIFYCIGPSVWFPTLVQTAKFVAHRI